MTCYFFLMDAYRDFYHHSHHLVTFFSGYSLYLNIHHTKRRNPFGIPPFLLTGSINGLTNRCLFCAALSLATIQILIH